MSSTFDDTVFDFDLNFLNQSSKPVGNVNIPNKAEKQRKSIILAKKKTIATDSLIRRYYEKKEILDQTERDLVASKDECRQVCVDYKNLMEKYGNLEQQKQQLDIANHELHTQYVAVQNQFVALQSHVNQLQVLVTEYERQMDTMKEHHKIELEMQEKRNKFSAQKNIQEMLKRHINLFIQVAVGKKKLNDIPKNILMKYEDTIGKSLASAKLELKSDENAADIDPESISSQEELLIEKETAIMEYKTGNAKSIKRLESDHDLDEVVSSGRGSSLAFSDSLQSPEYYIHDSPAPYSVPVKQISVATSPITILETVNRAVSPIIFENYVSLPLISNEVETTTLAHKTTISIDVGVQVSFDSPDKVPETLQSVSENLVMLRGCDPPVILQNVDVSSASPPINSRDLPSPVEFTNHDNDNDLEEYIDMSDDSDEDDHCINNESNDTEKTKCLEQNYSKNTCVENDDDDYEVESILNIMRWKEFKMLSPIPATPVTNNNSPLPNNIPNKTDTILSDRLQHTCKESMKIHEDHKLLHAGLAHLAKEIMNIKSILKKKLPDESISEIGDFVDSCQDIIDTNKQIQIEEPRQKSPIRPSPVPTEFRGFAEDKMGSSLFDKPLETPSQKSLIIEEESQDTPMTEAHNTSTIQNRIQFEDGPSIEENQDLINDDDPESLDYTGPDLIICNYDEPITSNNSLENGKCKKHRETVKKLTKLQKIRRRLLPKSKITGCAPRSEMKKNKVANKKLISNINKPKKVVTESDNSSTLNDKKVYEKALKVMADLKSVQKKQLKSKRKTVLNKLVDRSESDSVVETINHHQNVKSPVAATPNKKNKIDKLFEPIISNGPKKRPRRDSGISDKDKDEYDNLNSSYLENEDKTPRKIKRRGLKRAAEMKCPEEQSRRILRSSVRRQASVDSNEFIHKTNSSTLPPEKIQESVDVDSSHNINNETEPPTNIMAENNENQVKLDANINHLKESENVQIVENNNTPDPTSPKSDQNMKSVQLTDATPTKTDNQKNNSDANQSSRCIHPKDSILCKMIEQHANYTGRRSRKTADALSTLICDKITASVAHIMDLPADQSKPAMDKLVIELQNWKVSNFLSGLMKYLKHSERKVELFNKLKMPPAPPMSKPEQIMLYVIVQLNNSKIWKCNVINDVLDNIEFTLFQLNNTPHFDTIESMSHFYAVLCRYIKNKSRLRLFMMDAMYCLQFKSIPLIKQSIEVWMHAIPISSMNLAKSPLVMVLVYLLHFYRCEDRFNRVSEIRNMLQRKYLYNFTEWNDYKILEMLRKSIKELRDIPIERKMMKLALIIISKRLGFRWCQENIIKKMLLPLIEKEVVSEKSREFCVSMLGPLLRPFPPIMNVQGEITVNQMLDMLEQNPSPAMEEAIFTSLIYIYKHNPNQILKALTSWSPQKVSPEFEGLLKDFIQNRPVKGWKTILSRLPID